MSGNTRNRHLLIGNHIPEIIFVQTAIGCHRRVPHICAQTRSWTPSPKLGTCSLFSRLVLWNSGPIFFIPIVVIVEQQIIGHGSDENQ
jgi:hypothetical protein